MQARSRVCAVLAALTFALSSSARADDVPSPTRARYHETMGEFDEAAADLERRTEALEGPTAEEVTRGRAWIERALTYRIALGDAATAMRDARSLARWTVDRERVAEAELDAATVWQRARQWTESARFYEDWLRRHARDAGPRLRVRALTELGDARRESGDTTRALDAYRRAMAITPRARDTEDTQGDPWLARARFWGVEPDFQRFMARELPPATDLTTRRAYDTWVQRALTPFVHAQRAELERLTTHYREVIDAHEPEWEIAAFHHLAAIYERFGRLIDTAPVAPDLARNPDLIDAYRALYGEDSFSHLFLRNAKEGYQRCLQRANMVPWSGTWARRCEESLATLDRWRFPRADEFVPSPDQGLSSR
jgi:tetratricopeptide (TPR) repeat protein